MSRKALSIISLICYLAFALGGGAMALYMYLEMDKLSGAGGFEGLGAIGLAVIMVLALAYAAVGILPSIFKLIDIFADKKFLSGLCIPFDIAFNIANVALLGSSVIEAVNGSGEIGGIIFAAALLAVSLTAFISNIRSLSPSAY